MPLRSKPAFTLAELLIALAILGVIATFTIPKVLQSQQDGKYNAAAKEAASMIAGAFSAYKLSNTVSSSTGNFHLTQYMNYVRLDTASVIDDVQTHGTYSCATYPCLKLHNGGTLMYWNQTFAGTATTNGVAFIFDPDGRETVTGSTNGPGKAVEFVIYTNGRLTTYAQVLPGSANSDGVVPNDPNLDPPWFSWD